MSRSRAPRIFAGVALCAAAWLSVAESARAFSDIERFPQPAQTGGGGGRLFTGSPLDSYTCGVCHRGALERPKIAVYGLPLSGYLPGQTYDVEIAWENGQFRHALHAEIVNPEGRAGGQLALLDPAQLDPRGRCGSQPDEQPADYMIEGEGRQIVGVAGCGASHLRFRFTAPDLPEVTFTGSVVRSDSSVSADGDGVEDLHRVLRRAGEPAPQALSNCAVVHSTGSGRGASALVLLGILAATLARTRSFRGRRSRACR